MNSTGYYEPQEQGATFGEYNTTTSVNGVQSHFTPNIDPLPSTNQYGGYQIVSNEVTAQPSVDILQASSVGEGSTFGEYNTTTKVNGVDSMFAENIDAQPAYGTYMESTPIVTVPELQSNIPIIEDNTTLQTFESPIIETNEIQNIPGIDINTYQTTTPIIDQTQIIETTPVNVTSPVLDTGLTLDNLQFQNYETIQTTPTIPVTAPVEPPVNVIQTQPIPVPSPNKITVTVPKKIIVPVPKIHKVYVPSSSSIQTSVPITQSILPSTQTQVVQQPIPTTQLPVSVASVPAVPVAPRPVYTTSSVPAVPVAPRPVYTTSSVPAVPVAPRPVYTTASVPAVPVAPRPVYTTTSVTPVPVAPRPVYTTASVTPVPVAPRPVYTTASVTPVPVAPRPAYTTASIATVPAQPTITTVPVAPRPVYSTSSINQLQNTVPVATIPSVQPTVIPQAQVPTQMPIVQPLTTVPVQSVARVPITPSVLPQAPLPQIPVNPMVNAAPIAAGMRRPPVYNATTYRPNLGTYRAITGARTNMIQPGKYASRTYNARRL